MDERIYTYTDDDDDLCMALGERWVWWSFWGQGWRASVRPVVLMSDTEAIHYLLTGEVPRE